MTSASTPPARKKPSVAKRYIRPIRLWSVVVSQPSTPGRCAQIRSRRSLVELRREPRPPSPQALQVGGERVDLRAVERERRASSRRASRAAGRRSSRGARAGSFGIVSAASMRREATCVRSGPAVAAAPPCRGSCGSPSRPARGRSPAPRRCSRRRAARGDARLVREPGAERGRRLGDDLDRHVRVLQPAELRALAAVAPGPVGLEQDPVRRGRGSGRPSGSAPAARSSGSRRRSCRRGSRACRPGCGSRSRSRPRCPDSAPPRTTGGRSRGSSARSSPGRGAAVERITKTSA